MKKLIKFKKFCKKSSFLYKFNKKLKKCRKKHCNFFKFSNDAFFIGKKFKISKNLSCLLLLIILVQLSGFTAPVLADDLVIKQSDNKLVMKNGAVLDKLQTELVSSELVIASEETEFVPYIDYFDEHKYKFVSWGIKSITAYNSEAAQTDGSPCITANGFNVCEHGIEDTIAANFLKFGAKVRIPELFGNRIFTVRDRMNARYPNRIDIWMKEKAESKQFGVQYANIEVILEQ